MEQTIIDIAVQSYGNPEAVAMLIADNPELITDSVEFELTGDIDATGLIIRDEDDLMNKKVLKELEGKVIVSY